MKDKLFFDTNFLIYLFTNSSEFKKSKARKVLRDNNEVPFVISTQVIKEFTNISLKKYQIDLLTLKKIYLRLKRHEIVQVNFDLIESAVEIQLLYKYSFYDSLIISSAISSNCTILITEDMQHGQSISGLKIHNPFL